MIVATRTGLEVTNLPGNPTESVPMPSILKSRLALAALLAVFLIPIGTSSLRGLTHIATCEAEVAKPFSVIFEDGEAIVLSSIVVTAEQAEESGICGGLDVDIQAAAPDLETAQLTLIVANNSEFTWRGTVAVALGDLGMMGQRIIPISIGSVAPGETESETVTFTLGEGFHEFSGSLLIGP